MTSTTTDKPCRAGHYSTRDPNGTCSECRRLRERKDLPSDCPKCHADLTSPANVITRTDNRSGRVTKMCRPCKIVAARAGGQKRAQMLGLAVNARHESESTWTPGMVAAFLDRARKLEDEPAYIRHPIPSTDVVYRRRMATP